MSREMSLRQDRKPGGRACRAKLEALERPRAVGCGESSHGSKRKLRGASLLFNPLIMKGRKALLPGPDSCVYILGRV